LLREKMSATPVLALLQEILTAQSVHLNALAFASRSPPREPLPDTAQAKLVELSAQIDQLHRDGFDEREPQAFAACSQIMRRLQQLQTILTRMSREVQSNAEIEIQNATFLDTTLQTYITVQSFSPKLLISNLHFNSGAFRFALRVSTAVAIGMVIGHFLPNAHAHSYWIALTIVVIMKPAFSLTKQRNTDRLIGTVMGCVATFGLLQITTEPFILFAAFAVALALCFVTLVLMRYLIYCMFVSITVLLALHGLLPNSVNLPLERGLDTIIGSLIAFGCSFLWPWWEAKSLPSLARTIVDANAALVRASATLLRQSIEDLPAWQLARQNAHLAFSNFAMAIHRMINEPASKQAQLHEYQILLLALHAISADTVNILGQVRSQDASRDQALRVFDHVDQALASKCCDAPKDMPIASGHELSQADWLYVLRSLQTATYRAIDTLHELQSPSKIACSPTVTPNMAKPGA
jgi:uncharacterized membrane protein YccC